MNARYSRVVSGADAVSPVELRRELLADGWNLLARRAGDTVIGGYRLGDGHREFVVMDETGTGQVFLGRWVAASDLVWVRMADGWRETTHLLNTFPDEPAEPWLPARLEELLTAAQRRQAALLTPTTAPQPDERPRGTRTHARTRHRL
ncbi:hypothetical protein [Actinokineospora spheciospongiae]|uniref:hypothetical protein n=1 Tax=Actinokineospora spheciospongiae TaxID=909613 RepID=UPI000550999E|nr:hypothetical protein [Actinokineospora spheciospongiae]